ncbi:DUF1648 domain-containing protein [Chryseobacterium sp. SNU WT5]|uniref:DUF1648 domain-containing protein n=1 Tax=Chryseobacterium sp. SNU WT5 TaxID=2594269 RepID=UPI00117D2F47|nr:DUF1648 domain-containing protein [Chryseobacterium sp. SNU WT5]QDP85628.1 DUF1648 domain-containing protein [Chryseobacterium sp. SNU WT5]
MKKLPFYLKITSFCLLIFIWDYIFIHYRELPKIIPIHFDFHGNPDGFAPKMMIWVLAGIATFLYLLLYLVSKNKNSSLLNMPQNVKDSVNASLIIDSMNLVVMLMLAVISSESISVGLGKADGLSPIINYLVILLIVGVVGILIYSNIISKRDRSQNSTN